MKSVNLDDILKSKVLFAVQANSPDITYNAIIAAMHEACKQVLELAAENAEIEISDNNGCRECGAWGVSEQSILETINQIQK